MLLKIFSQQQFLFERQIEEGIDYIIGRHQDCDIHIKVTNGISRKHLKLRLENNTINVELLSSLGELTYKGENHNRIQAQVGEKFSIGFFEFCIEPYHKESSNESSSAESHFSLTDPKTVDNENSANEIDLKELPLPQLAEEVNHTLNINTESPQQAYANTADIDTQQTDEIEENTLTASKNLQVYLHIISKSKQNKKTSYELNGNNWIIGRDEKASLQLPYPFVSRKHFELIHTNDGLYICDLGSGNGTKVNGKDLPTNNHIRIYSDDIIEIKQLKLKIELVDKKFNELVEGIQIEENFNSDMSQIALDLPEAFVKQSAPKKVYYMRGAIALTLCGLLYFQFSKNKPQQTQSRTIATTENNKKNERDPNQVIIMDIYNLGNRYYNNQDYISCIGEIERLHTITPEYKNSKKILQLCKNGVAVEEEAINRKNRIQQANAVKQKTQKIAQNCKDNFSQFKTKAELNTCLDKILILDPSHPTIDQLSQKWDDIIQSKAEAIEKKNLIKQKRINAENKYKRAVTLQKSGDYQGALKLYKTYLANGAAISRNKKRAQRNIASINKELTLLKQSSLAACNNSYKSQNLKKTVTDCTNLLKKYPSNSQALKYRNTALVQLRKKAKDLYSDANLEESLGNINSAIQKWQQIISFHVSTDEYYKKARRKLLKYEGL